MHRKTRSEHFNPQWRLWEAGPSEVGTLPSDDLRAASFPVKPPLGPNNTSSCMDTDQPAERSHPAEVDFAATNFTFHAAASPDRSHTRSMQGSGATGSAGAIDVPDTARQLQHQAQTQQYTEDDEEESGARGAKDSKLRGSNGRSNRELLLLDPKRVRRIMANRQSAAKSKERKQQYTEQLQQMLDQRASEQGVLSQQLDRLKRDAAVLEGHEAEARVQARGLSAQLLAVRQQGEALLRELVAARKAATGQEPPPLSQMMPSLDAGAAAAAAAAVPAMALPSLTDLVTEELSLEDLEALSAVGSAGGDRALAQPAPGAAIATSGARGVVGGAAGAGAAAAAGGLVGPVLGPDGQAVADGLPQPQQAGGAKAGASMSGLLLPVATPVLPQLPLPSGLQQHLPQHHQDQHQHKLHSGQQQHKPVHVAPGFLGFPKDSQERPPQGPAGLWCAAPSTAGPVFMWGGEGPVSPGGKTQPLSAAAGVVGVGLGSPTLAAVPSGAAAAASSALAAAGHHHRSSQSADEAKMVHLVSKMNEYRWAGAGPPLAGELGPGQHPQLHGGVVLGGSPAAGPGPGGLDPGGMVLEQLGGVGGGGLGPHVLCTGIDPGVLSLAGAPGLPGSLGPPHHQVDLTQQHGAVAAKPSGCTSSVSAMAPGFGLPGVGMGGVVPAASGMTDARTFVPGGLAAAAPSHAPGSGGCDGAVSAPGPMDLGLMTLEGMGMGAGPLQQQQQQPLNNSPAGAAVSGTASGLSGGYPGLQLGPGTHGLHPGAGAAAAAAAAAGGVLPPLQAAGLGLGVGVQPLPVRQVTTALRPTTPAAPWLG